jgi:hypothetical protein
MGLLSSGSDRGSLHEGHGFSVRIYELQSKFSRPYGTRNRSHAKAVPFVRAFSELVAAGTFS